MPHAQGGAISTATRLRRHSSRSVRSSAIRGVVKQRDVPAAVLAEPVADFVAHVGDLRVLFEAGDESIQDVAADDPTSGVAATAERACSGDRRTAAPISIPIWSEVFLESCLIELPEYHAQEHNSSALEVCIRTPQTAPQRDCAALSRHSRAGRNRTHALAGRRAPGPG